MAADGRTLAFACRCGELRGRIVDITPAAYTHVVCHCADCRSGYTYLGLSDPGSVAILQTTQDRVDFETGSASLAMFRHTSRGALRWYAECCRTPLFCTPLKPRLVHVGVDVARLGDASSIGPVQSEAFVPTRDGATRHRSAMRMVMRMASRIGAKNLNGEWRNTPFFDETGAPIRISRISTSDERAAALLRVTR